MPFFYHKSISWKDNKTMYNLIIYPLCEFTDSLSVQFFASFQLMRFIATLMCSWMEALLPVVLHSPPV